MHNTHTLACALLLALSVTASAQEVLIDQVLREVQIPEGTTCLVVGQAPKDEVITTQSPLQVYSVYRFNNDNLRTEDYHFASTRLVADALQLTSATLIDYDLPRKQSLHHYCFYNEWKDNFTEADIRDNMDVPQSYDRERLRIMNEKNAQKLADRTYDDAGRLVSEIRYQDEKHQVAVCSYDYRYETDGVVITRRDMDVATAYTATAPFYYIALNNLPDMTPSKPLEIVDSLRADSIVVGYYYKSKSTGKIMAQYTATGYDSLNRKQVETRYAAAPYNEENDSLYSEEDYKRFKRLLAIEFKDRDKTIELDSAMLQKEENKTDFLAKIFGKKSETETREVHTFYSPQTGYWREDILFVHDKKGNLHEVGAIVYKRSQGEDLPVTSYYIGKGMTRYEYDEYNRLIRQEEYRGRSFISCTVYRYLKRVIVSSEEGTMTQEEEASNEA